MRRQPSSGLAHALGARDRERDRTYADFVLSARISGDGVKAQSRLAGNVVASELATKTAVYVIGSEFGPPLKIGFSRKPAARLWDLRIASPTELKLYLVCWLARKDQAIALERRCHQILRESGRHLRGEWFNLMPTEAAKVIDCASIDVDCRLVPHKQLMRSFPLSKDPLAGCFWPKE